MLLYINLFVVIGFLKKVKKFNVIFFFFILMYLLLLFVLLRIFMYGN